MNQRRETQEATFKSLSDSNSLYYTRLNTFIIEYIIIVIFRCIIAVCSTLSKGVFALFGVTNTSSLRTTESLTSTFDMPYVSPSSPVNHTYAPSGFILRMRPSYELAIRDIIQYYKWERVFYIYDSPEGKLFLL